MAKDAKSAFCEDSRVKFPTLMHLMGMGFKYVSLKGLKTKYVAAPKTEFDPLTNILTDYFTDAYCTLNPKAEKKDAEDMLVKIQKSLQNDDLGRQFYNEILLNTGERIIDLSSPANFYRNNTFQVTTVYLCFFQHLLYSLKEDGKAAIVVPTGFITAKSGIAFKIRKHLVDGEKSILRGVVSMPSNIFANTGTNVSVVFIDKSGVDKPVLIDASKLGETIKENGNQKTKLRTEEIQQIVNTFRNKEVVEDFSVTPTFDEIKEKGYSFSAGQYFDIKIDYVDITEDEFNRRMDNFKTTLRQQFSESHRLEEEILKQLDCIGFNENVGKENCNE